MSVSVLLLLVALGSLTYVAVAVLAMVPVAAAARVQCALKVVLPEAPRVTAALMLPVPLAGHEPPLLALQVQVQLDSAATNVSATLMPVKAAAIGLLTTMV